MLFKDISFNDSDFQVHKNAYVGVSGDSITYISSNPPEDIHNFGDVYDGRDKLLMPGFVNAHSHAAATIILNNLVYAGQGSDICLTMVDGVVVYKDGQWPFIDIDKVKFEVADRRKRIMKEL